MPISLTYMYKLLPIGTILTIGNCCLATILIYRQQFLRVYMENLHVGTVPRQLCLLHGRVTYIQKPTIAVLVHFHYHACHWLAICCQMFTHVAISWLYLLTYNLYTLALLHMRNVMGNMNININYQKMNVNTNPNVNIKLNTKLNYYEHEREWPLSASVHTYTCICRQTRIKVWFPLGLRYMVDTWKIRGRYMEDTW